MTPNEHVTPRLGDQLDALAEQLAVLGTQVDTSQTDRLLHDVIKQLKTTRTIPSTALRLRERAVDAAVEYILDNPRFVNISVATSNIETLRLALGEAPDKGMVAEFGVYKGATLKVIAQHFADRTVHGFDSFVGLPETWGGTSKIEGSFTTQGRTPDLGVPNVEYHVGFFDKTVPPFHQGTQGDFSFVHLDADLYSSTKMVFDTLGARLRPGTVLVFDEYFGYHGWQQHEHRAFMEFLAQRGLDYQPLGIGHMNLAVRLTSG